MTDLTKCQKHYSEWQRQKKLQQIERQKLVRTITKANEKGISMRRIGEALNISAPSVFAIIQEGRRK